MLAAMLFPAFSSAKNAGNTTVTLANIRQLGEGFGLYEADYDDGLPSVTHGLLGEGKKGGWVYYFQFLDHGQAAGRFNVSKGTLYQYVKNKDVYLSANDPGSKSSGLSFAFNGCLSVPSMERGLSLSKPLNSIALPSGTMLLGEEGTGISMFGAQAGTNDGYFNPVTDQFAEWHDGKTAILFVDSHAKVTRAQSHLQEIVSGTVGGKCP